MNDSEKTAYEYLAHRGFASIVYEPDGRVPPDFLVEGRVAVEVRRLNQNEESPTGPRGLEEVSKPLGAVARKVLASMGPPSAGVSWFVMYIFRRPLPPWKELQRMLTVALRNFRDQPSHQPGQVRVAEKFRLTIIRAGTVHPTFFVLGGSSDLDSGGFVVAEMGRNLRICIAEKTRKVARVRSRYPEWWLVLDDRIGYGTLDESNRRQLRELVQLDDDWDKVILVNPLNPSKGFEL